MNPLESLVQDEGLVRVQDTIYSPGAAVLRHREEEPRIIPSDDDHCDAFAHEFSEFLRKKYPARKYEDRSGEIFMAVNEQVINFKEHANHNDQNRKIKVRHWREGNIVTVHVAGDHEQENYDVRRWFRKEQTGELFPHKRGWGMTLTKQFANRILVDSNGGGVMLMFELFPRIIIKQELPWQIGKVLDYQCRSVTSTKESYVRWIDDIEAHMRSHLNEKDTDRACAGLIEGMKNYCEHSYEWSPDGKVRLQIWMRDKGTYARFKSDGKGFDPTSVAYTPEMHGLGKNPNWDSQGREGKFGWGSMIIKAMADYVAYSPNGKVLDLGFRHTSS